MKDEIKVGQVWKYKFNSITEAQILYVGDDRVFLKYNKVAEGDYPILDFLENYTIKKPEPVLKKLVAWFHINGDFACLSLDNKNGHHTWTKKELIVKDGSLYVDMSEVGE